MPVICRDCKYLDVDYEYDEQGDEYPVCTCSKGNDTSLDYECKDFKKYKPRKYKEKDTECDKCEHLEVCIKSGECIDCTMDYDTRSHYICGRIGCVKDHENNRNE